MKRTRHVRVIGTAALLVAGLVLAGCSAGGNDSASGNVRFTWWGSDARNAYTNAVIKDFESANKGRTIKGEPVDWAKYWERLNVQAAGGNLPCVTQTLTFALNDYASKGLFEDVSKVDGIDLGSIDKSVLSALKSDDGATYMVPYGIAPSAIFYNKSLEQQYRITVPAGNVTWDQFFSWLEDTRSKLPADKYVIDYPYDTPVEVMTYLASKGTVFEDGKPVFKQSDLEAWFAEWKKLQDEKVVLPGSRIADYANGGHEQSAIAKDVVFASARPANAFVPVENGLKANGTPAEIGYFLEPVAKNGKATDLLPINGFSIPKTCKDKKTAAAFIDYWVNDKQANIDFAANNGAPTVAAYRSLLSNDPKSDPSTKYTIEVAEKVVDRGTGSIQLPAGFQANFQDAYQRLSISVLTGATSPADAAKQLFTTLSSGS